MSTPRPDDRPPSVLSDSWTTLSVSDTHSEDDTHSVHTDSASWLGTSAADDVASLDDQDEEHSEAENTDTDTDTDIDIDIDIESRFSESPGFEAPDHSEEGDALDDSKLTARDAFLAGTDPIIFSEPDEFSNAQSTVELKHILCSLDETNLQGAVRDRTTKIKGDLVASASQTVAQKGLDLDRPFRVIYVGEPEFKASILEKLGDVLIANASSTSPRGSKEFGRFHVVPSHLGNDDASNYAELLPLNVQLTVDDCTAAYDDVQEPDRISLVLGNGARYSSYRTGTHYKISSTSEWSQPDLAIIFVGDSETKEQLTRRYISYYFMKRHGIPSMFISESSHWTQGQPVYPVDPRCLHIALEAYRPSSQQPDVIGRCPVDMNTFERISPEQLNRNLAAIIKSSKENSKPSKPRATEVREICEIQECPKTTAFHQFAHSIYESNPVLKHVTMLLICLVTVSLGYAGVKYLAILLFQFFTSSSSGPLLEGMTTSMSASRTTPWSTIPTVGSTTTSPILRSATDMSLAACDAGNSLTVHDYLTEMSRPVTEKPNESDQFQVHVIGDCHVIIRSPSAAGWGNGRRFGVKVTRGEEKLPFELGRLFDGVYALQLAREDAYGLLNVAITTKTKPTVEQVTEVDFGTAWLKITNWKRAARALSSQLRSDLNAAPVVLSEAYNRFSFDMRKLKDAINCEVESAHLDSVRQAADTATAITAKSMKLYEDMQKRFWKGFDSSVVRLLRERAECFHRDASKYADDAWAEMYRQARKVHKSARKMNLSHIGRRAREMTRSHYLALAQRHARDVAEWGKSQRSTRCDKKHACQMTSR